MASAHESEYQRESGAWDWVTDVQCICVAPHVVPRLFGHPAGQFAALQTSEPAQPHAGPRAAATLAH